MRLVVHDYSGHPGQMQLSRALARDGHEVIHQYCSSYTTGRGAVTPQADDPVGLTLQGLSLTTSFARYSVRQRIRQEITYGAISAKAIRRHRPVVAVLSNIPLLALWIVATSLTRAGIPYVFWQQDVYSAAIGSTARRRLGPAGAIIASIATRIERRIARQSAAIVPVSGSFLEILTEWEVAEKAYVAPNWAPIEELPVQPRVNSWGKRNDLCDRLTAAYSGTLGIKHDPSLLVATSQDLADQATVFVVSEGLGRDVLEKARITHKLQNLRLFDFQPYEFLPEVLGSADVLIAILEPDASRYSVPSKVLTYLCAARPIVAAIPEDNAVAHILREAGAGIVVPPGDANGLTAAVRELLSDPDRRAEMGANARAYAETTFAITTIAKQFESILGDALARSGSVRRM